VNQLARHGSGDSAILSASLESIFITDPATVEAVYADDLTSLALGLRTLYSQLEAGNRRDVEITRYAVSLLHLERKLAKKPQALQQIANGIERVREQRRHFELLHPTILAALAEIYATTISPIGPRIMVKGENDNLLQPGVAEKVRALLLAGMRAAVLWRQCGGTRWQLLLGRGKLLRATRDLLNQIPD
jgi:high frequency lysogenization protein